MTEDDLIPVRVANPALAYRAKVYVTAVISVDVEATMEKDAAEAACAIVMEKLYPNGAGVCVLEEIESGIRDPDVWMDSLHVGCDEGDVEDIEEDDE